MRAGLAELVVVVGHDADRIVQTVRACGGPSDPPVRFVHNPDHGEGMGRSIAVGIEAVGQRAAIQGAVIAQGDMPDLDAGLIDALCGRFAEYKGERVVCPWMASDRQGNPVVWPRRLFADLSRLAADRGGKALIAAEGAALERVPQTDRRAAVDIDTPEQLAAYNEAAVV
jgi:molybdenum cofactor cytidylyltransferase